MAEYIDREWLLDLYDESKLTEKEKNYGVPFNIVRQNILDAPAVDVAPVVHGRRIHDGRRIEGGIDWCHCSECGKSGNFCARTNYCPNCGAKMDIENGGDGDEAD